MSRQPQQDPVPWLPIGALQPASFEQALSRLLEDWSSHWFVKAKASGRTRLREIGIASSSALEWLGWGSECGISIDETGRLALAEAMLGRPVPTIPATDRPLLDELIDKCLRDLVARISWEIDRDRSPAMAWQPISQLGGICWDIGLRRSGAAASLVIGRPALVRWRKSLAPKQAAPRLGGIFAALKSQPVELGLMLGKGALGLAELENLARGDVVILDSNVAAPLGLTAAGRPTGIGAKLSEMGEVVQLDIIEKKKVSL